MNAPDSASQPRDVMCHIKDRLCQLVRFCDFCAYCIEVAGCGTSASLGGHQASLAASRLACPKSRLKIIYRMHTGCTQDAKIRNDTNHHRVEGAAHEVDLIIADQMLESFKALRFTTCTGDLFYSQRCILRLMSSGDFL